MTFQCYESRSFLSFFKNSESVLSAKKEIACRRFEEARAANQEESLAEGFSKNANERRGEVREKQIERRAGRKKRRRRTKKDQVNHFV